MKFNHHFYVKSIPQAVESGKSRGCRFSNLLDISTDIMEKYEVYLGVFDNEAISHPIHRHSEEELIFIISGNLDLISETNAFPGGQAVKRLPAGTLHYLPADDRHTHRGAGPEKTHFVIIRWQGTPCGFFKGQEKRWSYQIDWQEPQNQLLFEGPTRYTTNFIGRFLHVKPGSMHGWHCHPYDLMILLLSGRLQSMYQQVASPAVLFFPAGTPHWDRNTGPDPVSMLTLEFSKIPMSDH